MGNAQANDREGVETAQVTDFVVAKLGGKFLRFQNLEAVPSEGITVGPITLAKLKVMSTPELGSLYSDIAGVAPKNFKNPKVAIESLAYQINKTPLYDPAAEAKPAGSTSGKTAKLKTAPKAKAKDTAKYELLAPTNIAEAIAALAPQARQLVTIMVALAKEKGANTFTEKELVDKLNVPEISALLKTRQLPVRILQYYKSNLIGSGLIKVS